MGIVNMCFPWWHYFIWLFVAALGAFLGTYLREKGKNVATKEDIGKITDGIEKVRSVYAKEIEAQKGRQQLRVAALDRRLEAHQQAYTFWRELRFNIYNKEKLNPIVMECQDWWNKNCLYLSKEAREAFNKAYICASDHADYVRNSEDRGLIKGNWQHIERAGEAIVQGVELPSLGEAETEFIGSEQPKA